MKQLQVTGCRKESYWLLVPGYSFLATGSWLLVAGERAKRKRLMQSSVMEPGVGKTQPASAVLTRNQKPETSTQQLTYL
jgi:hypothetical protein